ncbi:hypothetical protein [Halobellus inordinatus]|uniref:hypothetical protein n=1 Tax=Halobellus inordinatus TaxID=1126236 RepID=UPI002114FDB2|nr:hypothetical protein [Halobellus ramosii]
MGLEPFISRRGFLRAGVLSGSLALAGCLDGSDPVFQEISFEESHLVVRLHDEHAVEQLNLIAPDGSIFSQSAVATGATTVRIEMLDLREGLSSYDHYTPGKYELVAILPERTVTRELDLRPELQVVDVQQRPDATSRSDFAQLEVTIENVGTASTWVYEFAYRGVPSRRVEDRFFFGPGIPYLNKPSQPAEIILGPNETQTYVGTGLPLLFDAESVESCYEVIEATILVGVASGEVIEKSIQISMDGEILLSSRNEYACTDLSIQLIEDNTGYSGDGT